jgi:hypothetical protein
MLLVVKGKGEDIQVFVVSLDCALLGKEDAGVYDVFGRGQSDDQGVDLFFGIVFYNGFDILHQISLILLVLGH